MYCWVVYLLLFIAVTHAINYVLQDQTREASIEAHSKLVNALQNFKTKIWTEIPAEQSDGRDHFADLMLSIFIDPADVHYFADEDGEDVKYFAGLHEIQTMKRDFVVYSIGNGCRYHFTDVAAVNVT